MAQKGMLGSSKRASVNFDPREQILRRHLEPLLDQLQKNGWKTPLVCDAVVDHYARTGKEIFPEDLGELLSQPVELLIEYKRRRGKPNNPSNQQQTVLNRLIPDAENREKTIQILSRAYVVDMLGAIEFKEIVDQIASHNFVEPQIQPCASGKCCQGRTLIWQ